MKCKDLLGLWIHNLALITVHPGWCGEPENVERVRKLHKDGNLKLTAIDEAHLIYEWVGFRTHYHRHEGHLF